MTRNKVSSDEKWENQDFDLFKALEAVDKKDYNWFSLLTEEQKKKFVPYMMLYWNSAVKGNVTLARYYLLSTNNYANISLFNERVQQHPELQWLMLCASSPDMGKQYHQWIPHLSAKIGNLKEAAKLKDVTAYIEKVFVNSDKNTIKEYAIGFTEQQNHKHRIAKIYPTAKLEDIDILSQLISKQDLDKYDEDCGE